MIGEVANRMICVGEPMFWSAPETAVVGDVVCIFHGAEVPFVLRPEANDRYRLLGEAYVHGIMDGEFMDTAPAIESFILC